MSFHTQPKFGKHNSKRTKRMGERSLHEVIAFAKSGSLSAACAINELGLRGLGFNNLTGETYSLRQSAAA